MDVGLAAHFPVIDESLVLQGERYDGNLVGIDLPHLPFRNGTASEPSFASLP